MPKPSVKTVRTFNITFGNLNATLLSQLVKQYAPEAILTTIHTWQSQKKENSTAGYTCTFYIAYVDYQPTPATLITEEMYQQNVTCIVFDVTGLTANQNHALSDTLRKTPSEKTDTDGQWIQRREKAWQLSHQ